MARQSSINLYLIRYGRFRYNAAPTPPRIIPTCVGIVDFVVVRRLNWGCVYFLISTHSLVKINVGRLLNGSWSNRLNHNPNIPVSIHKACRYKKCPRLPSKTLVNRNSEQDLLENLTPSDFPWAVC